MKNPNAALVLTMLLGLLSACGDPGDAAGGHVHGAPTVAVTHWTDSTELFMEYPLLVAGSSGRAAIHVTELGDFSPLSEGQAALVLRAKGGRLLEFRGGPSSPGIFGVDLKVEEPGLYDMSLRVDAPGLQDVHELGQVTVYARGEPFPAEARAGESISFLKEQQWTLEFGTTAAVVRAIRPSVAVPATVQPRSGGDALLTASVRGRIDPAANAPLPGAHVRKGELLARIAPLTDDLRDSAGLRADLVEAEQDHLLAQREHERAERLVTARALPARRLDEAEAATIASSASLAAAQERWNRFEAISQSGGDPEGTPMFALRAPFDGVLAEVRFTAGQSVEANEPLMRVVDPDRVHVVGAITESLTASLETIRAGELILDGRQPLSLAEPIAISPVVDPLARTTAIRFALDNRLARLRIGQAVQLRLFVGDEKSDTAIPASSVVDDGGRPVVFVQIAGESFERRPVQLGSRADGHVHVIDGVEPGERVVHVGAYLVRLAAMSTQIPAHGHVH